ncbi:MAG: MlaD family protein, partial [Pseudomonadota bacterium]
TNAKYTLIGAFTILGFLGILGFLLWFARVEIDRQFSYYDVLFPTVSGLSNASEVRFSGLLVGKVVDVRLDPARTGRVVVRLEVDADTPVRTSSTATIESLGVTGVAYVGLSAGDPEDPLLEIASGAVVPLIGAGRSTFQTLSEGAPALIDEVLEVARNISDLLGPETQDRINAILSNVENASSNLDAALNDFSQTMEAISLATDDFAVFSNTLQAVSGTLDATLGSADTTLQQITALAERAETTLDIGDQTLISGRQTLETATEFLNSDVAVLIEELETTLTSLRDDIGRVASTTEDTLASVQETSAEATARLRQTEQTVTLANKALDDFSVAVLSVEDAATQFDEFVGGEGTTLVQETRALVANATTLSETALSVAETDLPQILGDVRAASETVARVVADVGADLQSAASRTDEVTASLSATFESVATTFETANGTLERLNVTLATGDDALEAAEGAFSSFDALVGDESTLVAQLQSTLAQLETTIAQASDDIPVITQELRRTAESASAAFGQVENTAESLGPSLQDFASNGLPQYARLARETRELVANLRQLVRQIERDPARYLLGRSAPEFRP